jgi:protein-L-isoaspartate O-methyltransferase
VRTDTVFFEDYREFSSEDPRIHRLECPPTVEFLSLRYAGMLPVDVIKNHTVLDIGSCVSSVGAWVLANGAKHYTGLEIQTELATIAERNLGRYFDKSSWQVINADAELWMATMEWYDVIVLASALHTFADPINAIKRLTEHTNCLIIESTHPHIYSEILTEIYEKDIFTEQEKNVLHTLLESRVFKDTFRTILEEKLPVMYNRNSTSIFKSENKKPIKVEANSTYPSIGFLNNIMSNLGFQANLTINQNLKDSIPSLYNWPGRFAVEYKRCDQRKILRFQDYDHS